MKKYLTTLTLLLLCCIAGAQTAQSSAQKSLSAAKLFALGGIGYAGEISQGERDFWVLLDQPPDRALAAFEEVFNRGTPEAKCYALVGIRKLNPAHFHQLLLSIAEHSDTVRTADGCLFDQSTLAKTAERINHGSYDAWLEHHPRHS